MKKEYIKSLEKALNEYNVEDRKVVLKKYIKRYEFGLESGLSEEKVEEMLGDPIEIAKKLSDVIDVSFEEKKDYECKINVTTEDLEFHKSKDDGIHVELEELDPTDYLIDKDDKHLTIKRSKSNYFGTQINGTINVEMPKGLTIKSYEIGSISSDIEKEEMKASYVYMHTNTGDINVDSIQAESIKLNTVSGDVTSNSIKTKNIKIETVSGDIVIDSLIADELIVSTISGDVIIKSAYVGKVTSNSVSGDVLINGEPVGLNVKNSIKSTFGKIKKVFTNEK